jgi:hypothetical protein
MKRRAATIVVDAVSYRGRNRHDVGKYARIPIFVVTVLSVDSESISKAFGKIADARRWTSSEALKRV